MTDGTIGDYLLGQATAEDMARFTEKLNDDLTVFDSWGEIPAGTTYADLADALFDTLCGHASEGPILVADLPALLEAAFDQLTEPEDGDDATGSTGAVHG